MNLNSRVAVLTRAALLLALALLFQSIRLLFPIPPLASTFLIGSLMNACFLLAAGIVGMGPTLMIVFLVPIVAYFQQVLPLPIFIIPVALGNAIFIGIFLMGRHWKYWVNIVVAAASKAIFMYIAFSWLLNLLEIHVKIATGLLFIMSWPQFITGIIGGALAGIIKKRLRLL
ncbi:MAG: hypothetical protein K0R78_713 [Pelosinus sp.]|jgi:hypothetical protein|nr:hypothetical protein [Pelosinus sp.]